MSLADIAARGYVIEDWRRWQQGECGWYAAALIHTYPHLRLGGIEFYPEPGYLNPDHYVAHDGTYAYDSAGRHLLPYKGVCGSGLWHDDIGTPYDHGYSFDNKWHDASDYLVDAIAHATRHNILPLEARHDATV